MDAALDAAARDRVFPVHEIVNGKCSCGKDCDSPGKHPRISNGVLGATKDEAQIRAWWTKWPNANIGAAAGDRYWVLDIDPRHGGNESLMELVHQHGMLPETEMTDTGGGGRHYKFAMNGVPIRNIIGLLAGIDVKATGGYTLLAPSNHISGGHYSEAQGSAELADAPSWLMEMVKAKPQGSKERLDTASAFTSPPQGERYKTLCSLVGRMRYQDFPERATLAAALEMCSTWDPAVEEKVIVDTVRRYYRNYEPGPEQPPHPAEDPDIAEMAREREAIQRENDPQPVSDEKDGSISGRVRDYVDSIEGVFTTGQLYQDLGLTTVLEKTAARMTLNRMKGHQIQPHGNHAGCWRIIRGDVVQINFENVQTEELRLWMPFELHNYARIMPGNIVVVTGDPDAGKTAFVLNVIKENIGLWNCHYFNSEMGEAELSKRLDLFQDFPIHNPHFHAYERSSDFQDVIQPGKYSLNVIDYLEITEEFYLVGKLINDIHRVLGEAVAIIAIQKRDRNSDMPLGAQRSLEKPRLAIALKAGNRSEPNKATILKCKNRKTDHSMIGRSREYKLIGGSEFRCNSPEWI